MYAVNLHHLNAGMNGCIRRWRKMLLVGGGGGTTYAS